MRIGFSKLDITPRVGVEMCGFGAFLHRYSIAVRDRLWARAMALSDGQKTLLVFSLDLIGVSADMTRKIRGLVAAHSGLEPADVMVHCTHTHSAPPACELVGWGERDTPYLEILPHRVARAGAAALSNLQEASLSYARVPCEGIGVNREYDRDAPPLDLVLRDDWRPAKPELTDTACDVLRADAGGRLLGFVSHFGCHPVVCCQETRYIHGDYPGVATNMLERENPGSVGLFLQGAHADVNSCCAHKPEQDSLLALDVIAARYANSVRFGLKQARPLDAGGLASARREISFTRKPFNLEMLRQKLAEQEALFAKPGATDQDRDLRMAAVVATNLRRMIAKMERGDALSGPAELQGFRAGPLAIVASPFETFQAIKNDVRARSGHPIAWVLSVTNDYQGYAPDRTAAARGGYAADVVPFIVGLPPLANIHDELVSEFLALGNVLA